jgi:hypothetical protein
MWWPNGFRLNDSALPLADVMREPKACCGRPPVLKDGARLRNRTSPIGRIICSGSHFDDKSPVIVYYIRREVGKVPYHGSPLRRFDGVTPDLQSNLNSVGKEEVNDDYSVRIGEQITVYILFFPCVSLNGYHCAAKEQR